MKPEKKSTPRAKTSAAKPRSQAATKSPVKTAVAKPARRRVVAVTEATPPTAAVAPAAPVKRAKTKRVARHAPQPAKPLVIPPELLQTEPPPTASLSGPGHRYALSPAPAALAPGLGAAPGELPESYGTGALLLAARDPHWLYAHWDFTRDQLRQFNRQSLDGHLILRIYRNAFGGLPAAEVHVHPESRNWFVHVEAAGTRYLAELGYYTAAGKWNLVAASGATLTPPDSLSEDLSFELAALPAELPLPQLLAVVKAALRDHVPLMEAIQQLRAAGHPGLPDFAVAVPTTWSPAQERALARVLSMDEVRRVWIGSLEITELVRRHLARDLSSAALAQASAAVPTLGAIGSLASPFGGQPPRRGFWFNVNAELVIYGATEPDATVTIGGRTIKLRSDGSFSFRFALPDGEYDLPAAATAADGRETRRADLKFSRATAYTGEVAAHPQDPALKRPSAENVA